MPPTEGLPEKSIRSLELKKMAAQLQTIVNLFKI